MADKVEKEEKIVKEPVAVNAEGTRAVATVKKSQAWIVWLVIGCFGVLILLVAGAIFVEHAVRDHFASRPQATLTRSHDFMGFRGGFQNGTFYGQTSTTDGPTTTTTTQKYTYTEGVVTQVNSNNIVVAGNGKTQTIATNSSTKYETDKPAVNDTVRIVGTADSNNNVTATDVAVINN